MTELNGSAEQLAHYVITYNPSDYPGKFVVRKHFIVRGAVLPTGDAKVCESLNQARDCVPFNLFKIPRSPFDDPTIVETWV